MGHKASKWCTRHPSSIRPLPQVQTERQRCIAAHWTICAGGLRTYSSLQRWTFHRGMKQKTEYCKYVCILHHQKTACFIYKLYTKSMVSQKNATFFGFKTLNWPKVPLLPLNICVEKGPNPWGFDPFLLEIFQWRCVCSKFFDLISIWPLLAWTLSSSNEQFDRKKSSVFSTQQKYQLTELLSVSSQRQAHLTLRRGAVNRLVFVLDIIAPNILYINIC